MGSTANGVFSTIYLLNIFPQKRLIFFLSLPVQGEVDFLKLASKKTEGL
jgi:hypothetical protein